MRKVFRLVPAPVSAETVDALERLLTEARAGKVLGILLAAMYSHKEYVIGATGEAHRSPTFARGMLAALDDYLREMVRR